MLNKTQKVLQIEIISNSHEECFIDTHVGVALRFSVVETEYINIYRRLKKVDLNMKKMYPSLDNDLNCDIQLHDYPHITNNISVYHKTSFQMIRNDQPSVLLNIAITGSAAYAKMVFEEFKDDFEIVDNNNNIMTTAKQVVDDICNDIELSFWYMVGDNDYEDMVHIIDSKNVNTYLLDGNLQYFRNYVNSLDDQNYDKFINIILDDYEGEFGMDYMDKFIKISEINPLCNTKEIRDNIAGLCKNIKYADLINCIIE